MSNHSPSLAELIRQSGMTDAERTMWYTLLPLLSEEEISHLHLTLTAELTPHSL